MFSTQCVGSTAVGDQECFTRRLAMRIMEMRHLLAYEYIYSSYIYNMKHGRCMESSIVCGSQQHFEVGAWRHAFGSMHFGSIPLQCVPSCRAAGAVSKHGFWGLWGKANQQLTLALHQGKRKEKREEGKGKDRSRGRAGKAKG